MNPCELCIANDDDSDQHFCTGHYRLDYASASKVAAELTRRFGCTFYLATEGDLWRVNVKASCVWSILSQVQPAVQYDGGGLTYATIGMDPVIVRDHATLEDAIDSAARLATLEPSLTVAIGIDGDTWTAAYERQFHNVDEA